MKAFKLGFALGAALLAGVGVSQAQIAVAAHDGHSVLVKGVQVPVTGPVVDNVAILDLGQFPPRIKATVDVAASVVGPAQCVFVAKDESFAIVASANRAENGALVSDDRVSVIDIAANPPQVLQQVHGGSGTDCVSVNPEGSLAIVVNRNDGNLSVYSLKAKHLDAMGKVDLGNPKSTPGAVLFTPDGKNALVTRGDGYVSVLNIDGDKVSLDASVVLSFPNAYPLDISPDGKLAAVAGSFGAALGVVGLIDISRKPFLIVEAAKMPSASEGMRFSPDGKYLAVTSLNGSNRAADDRLFNDHAVLTIFAVAGQSLTKAAEAPLGQWTQGVVFSPDGKVILAQNMVEHNYSVFHFSDGKLTAEAPLAVPKGSPSTIGMARK